MTKQISFIGKNPGRRESEVIIGDDYEKQIVKILKIRVERKFLYGDSYNEMPSECHYWHAANKFKRLLHQLEAEKENKNIKNNYEKIDDNAIDIINYLIFFLIMREKENQK